MRLEKDFEDLFESFNTHEVRYCVVGSFAMAFHGKPRYTKDVDLLVDCTPENAKRIVDALDEFGFASLGLREGDLLERGSIIQLGREPVRVDLILSIEGLDFDEIWSRRCTASYGKGDVPFMGIGDLIEAKKLAGRKQDEADLELLREIQRERGRD